MALFVCRLLAYQLVGTSVAFLLVSGLGDRDGDHFSTGGGNHVLCDGDQLGVGGEYGNGGDGRFWSDGDGRFWCDGDGLVTPPPPWLWFYSAERGSPVARCRVAPE